MNWKRERGALFLIAAVFLAAYYLPTDSFPKVGARVGAAALESLHLLRSYAREHVLMCLVPAFFIAGAISVFVSKNSVMKYLGARANKALAYGVASVSGSVLAVCSCTVLPLFAGIYRMGAGLGPATAFLYAGPAINVLAIILTARVLGTELGAARAIGAVAFSIVIGLAMHLLFMKEETKKAEAQASLPEPEVARPLWQNGVFFALMIGILVFANWGAPRGGAGLWGGIYSAKWVVTSVFALGLAGALVVWFRLPLGHVALAAVPAAALAFILPGHAAVAFAAGVVALSFITSRRDDEAGEWFESSWGFAKQILPLLFIGVLVAGFLLGRPEQEGLIPSAWVARSVGGNSFGANLFASIAGAFMYFATLTEVPILQGLIGSGMGKGPALALLLAGPALSLPNMLVIRSVMGTKKTVAYVALVVVMATASGLIYGALFA